MKAIKITMFLVLTVLISCNKSDNSNSFTPTLPPISQTGENTFGCYIDGFLITPRDGDNILFAGGARGMKFISFGDTPNFVYNEIKIIDAKSQIPGLIYLHIENLHQNGIGTFNVKESNCNEVTANSTINILSAIWNEELEIFSWYCSIENSGTLTISRYDYENKIVSGIFSFSAVNKDDPNDIIEITDGRFDINWGTLSDTEFP